MISPKLRQKLQEKKSRVGLVGGSLKITEYDEAEKNIKAFITPEGWNINIELRKGFNPVNDKRQKAYARKKKIEDGLETLVSDVMLHELGHWELPYGSSYGCPYDIYNHDKILEAITQALPQDKKGQASYVANAFEDILVNSRAREYQGSFSGQVLFWDNEGLTAKERKQDNFTPFYEAFVKLNMHLIGDSTDKSLLKRHYSKSKKVDDAVTKVIKDLRLPENISEAENGTRILFNREQWPRMASIFARDIADLLETSPTERLSAFSKPGDGQEQGKPESGNGIEQKIGTREGKEEVAYGRYSHGEKQSTNITSYEQLDSLYRRLARDISVKVEAMTRAQSLAIAPLNFRPFDEERDDPTRIKTSKLIVGEEGITFAYPNQQLAIESRSKIQRKSFPDFKMVLLDNSGSMKEGINGNTGNTQFIPWGDNSKYHFALLGFYGIENFLQRQGISQYIGHGVSLFSSSTRYKEGNFQKLDEVRKFALSPEWGNTNLDARVLTDALNGRESFVLSISDGEIGNWASERTGFKKLAEKNYFAHIQIGSKNGFTQDLESWGLPVFYVQSGQDLSKLMVNVAKDTYKRFTRI
ncbi:MAG: hypothetical protein AABW41_05010 [Nanoarchaeota archaeon]